MAEGRGPTADARGGNGQGSRARRVAQPSPEAIEIAQYLYDAIRSHSSEFCAGMAPSKLASKLTGWAKAIDVGIRNDGMTLEGCRLAIDAAHRSEDDFWRSNLLSGKALRKHYEKLKMRASKAPGDGAGYTSDGVRLDEIDYGGAW